MADYRALLLQQVRGPKPAPHPKHLVADGDDDAVNKALAMVGPEEKEHGVILKAVLRLSDGVVIWEDGQRVQKPASELAYAI